MSYKDYSIRNSKIINDLIIIKPSVHWDVRGNIYSSYNKDFYKDILPKDLEFKHDKFAFSKHNVLRGLHGDSKTWKLVSCVSGKIFQVVVDLRKNSSTYMQWQSFVLDSEDYRQILIPPNFLNGYYVMSESAVFHYKLSYDGDYIDANDQMTYKWNDDKFSIKWPCLTPILQSRDKL